MKESDNVDLYVCICIPLFYLNKEEYCYFCILFYFPDDQKHIHFQLLTFTYFHTGPS